MSVRKSADVLAVLGILVRQGVDFIVVGAVSAVIQGVPVNTFDVDILHARAPENVKKLVAALSALDACYREHLPKRLVPEPLWLEGRGHHLLMTREGPLDVLGHVGRERTYEDLLSRSLVLDLGDGLSVRVLGLEALIQVKEEVGREKDLAMLPVLRRTLEEKRRLFPS